MNDSEIFMPILTKRDIEIKSQAEFDTLAASLTWFGATSVCFVGDGGNLKFTSMSTGLKIPQNVKQIQGMNNAIIDVTNFVYDGIDNKAALWYDRRPTTDDYTISDITVNCITSHNSVRGHAYGFANCIHLTNCNSVTISETNDAISFSHCAHLNNCTGVGTGSNGYGFVNCTQLTDCTGTGNNGFGFRNCVQLIGCTGTGIADDDLQHGAGFGHCSYLVNCIGLGTMGNGFYNCVKLTNCTGDGTGTRAETGHGFHSCTQLTNCTGIINKRKRYRETLSHSYASDWSE